ncbi:PREDICTED: centromere protein R isoform X5 [Chinchilla lanigera]|uniref:centromere protein R isoform X5 n=1 Tax=Chinchilla lanigera TaxID=34839 RepID=UPI00069785BC|nr:PREDICTED: centromere protein R isoform X5 [Chinchilla lanigera]
MPVKRSLKLDDHLEENSSGPSKIRKRRSITAYSPTTGTCQMSPFSSPTSSEKPEHRNRPSNGKSKKLDHLSLAERKGSPPKDDDELGPRQIRGQGVPASQAVSRREDKPGAPRPGRTGRQAWSGGAEEPGSLDIVYRFGRREERLRGSRSLSAA